MQNGSMIRNAAIFRAREHVWHLRKRLNNGEQQYSESRCSPDKPHVVSSARFGFIRLSLSESERVVRQWLFGFRSFQPIVIAMAIVEEFQIDFVTAAR